VGGGGASGTQGGEELSVAVGFAHAWRLIGRAAARVATLPRKMEKARAAKKIRARGIFARPLEERAGSPAL
jgi:hypothetical protein